MRALAGLLCLALGGCGSLSAAELPPAATPAGGAVPSGMAPPHRARADGGATIVTLDARDRRLTARGETTGTTGAGVGPAGVASDGRHMLYVSDTAGDGVVVAHTRPSLAITRRVALPDTAPYGIAYDAQRDRIWVALSATDEVAELAAGARPRVLRRYPTFRRPLTVRVRRDGRIEVAGSGRRQVLDPGG